MTHHMETDDVDQKKKKLIGSLDKDYTAPCCTQQQHTYIREVTSANSFLFSISTQNYCFMNI